MLTGFMTPMQRYKVSMKLWTESDLGLTTSIMRVRACARWIEEEGDDGRWKETSGCG